VVIPAYNEAERLPGSIPQVLRYLASEGYPHEVIVVDDGSADATSRIVEAIATEAPALRLLRTRHRGKAYAVRAGVLAARGERVLFTDADLSAPIAQAALLMRCLDDGYDIAIGSREGPGSRRYGEPAYRHIMGRAFNLAVRLITGAGYQDTQCGFKLFTRDAACDIFGRLLLYTDEAAPVAGPMVTGLDVEVLQVARRQGYRVREVGVEWHYSAGSKVRPALDTYRMLKDVARVKLNDVRGRYG
jgi:glycosyltransferase involved in cell wall biosynthesis